LSEFCRLHPPDVADFAPLWQRLPILDPADEHEAEPGNSPGELLRAAERNEREAPIVLRRVRLRADVGMKAGHAEPGLFENFPPDGIVDVLVGVNTAGGNLQRARVHGIHVGLPAGLDENLDLTVTLALDDGGHESDIHVEYLEAPSRLLHAQFNFT